MFFRKCQRAGWRAGGGGGAGAGGGGQDEQVFYDKFLCDKFYLLVCTRNFDNFFYDKRTYSKASMLAFEQVHLL